jgi:uracil-DNA glycosylase
MIQSSAANLEALLARLAACRICVETPLGSALPHAPRPVLQLAPGARLLVAGQAPGTRVHRSGRPFTDPSGDRLRGWMGISPEIFYDSARVAVVPMGFCFPGQDAGGADLPPRRECRPAWHDEIFAAAQSFELVLAVGRHAQDYHLSRFGHGVKKSASVSDRVARWREFSSQAPKIFPLPHPSWRNHAWLKRHPWFEAELIPELRREVARVLGAKAC